MVGISLLFGLSLVHQYQIVKRSHENDKVRADKIATDISVLVFAAIDIFALFSIFQIMVA